MQNYKELEQKKPCPFHTAVHLFPGQPVLYLVTACPSEV